MKSHFLRFPTGIARTDLPAEATISDLESSAVASGCRQQANHGQNAGN